MLNIFHSDIHTVTVGVNILIKLLWLAFYSTSLQWLHFNALDHSQNTIKYRPRTHILCVNVTVLIVVSIIAVLSYMESN